MKVLFIGVYRDGTGWSHAAIDYILALDRVGVDIVCRSVKLNNYKGELPERLLELESKDSSNCDIVIQNVLPHHMDYSGNFKKNIALFCCETSHFNNCIWPDKLNTMDEIWVSNQYMVESVKNSYVNKPVRVVGHPLDTSKLEQSYDLMIDKKNHFIFYFIGELIRRKNLAALIKAFHLEFAPEEPVSLLIKTNIHGVDSKELTKQVQEFCNQIKNGLKLYSHIDNYKKEDVISGYMTEEQMMQLHSSCDCFVIPSYGEAWCIPAIEAMGMGKTPIVTANTGMTEFVSNETGWVVPSRREPVFGVNDSFEDMYVGNEDWYSIDVWELREAMRECYQNDELRQQKSERGMKKVYDFSYEKIGKRMKDALYEY